MKLYLTKTLLAGALLVTSAASYADNSTDYFIQNDVAAVATQNPEGLLDYYQNYINWLLEQGYAPASIIASSVARGVTVADVVYMMSRSQPEDAEEYAFLAERLLPSLPGWVCSATNASGHRYDRRVDETKLEKSGSLAEVASLYFDEFERFIEVPEWQTNAGHFNAKVDELIEIKKAEIDKVSDSSKDKFLDSWWFLDGDNVPANNVVVASLYPLEKRIVLHARLQELEALAAQGVEEVPMMVMYNDNGHIPLSDVERVEEDQLFDGSEMTGDKDKSDFIDFNDGEITLSEVVERFNSDGSKVPPVREWRLGDHHLQARVTEMLEVFEVPEKEDIDAEDWQAAEQRLDSKKPVHVTLFASESEPFLDDVAVVAVAKERELERMPVVFFYHGMDRQGCGMPSACIPEIRAAAIAGADCPGCPDLFSSGDGVTDTSSFAPPGTVPPGTPPAGPPVEVPPVEVPPGNGPISPN